jgi:hypothetical protein
MQWWDKIVSAITNVPPVFGAVVVVVLGALLNAHLNRRRDERLRKHDAKSLAIAIRAELSAIRITLTRNAKFLKEATPPDEGFLTPDLAHQVRVLPAVLSKITLLEGEVIRSVLDAYAVIEQHTDGLVLMGARRGEVGSRRILKTPPGMSGNVIDLNTNLAQQIESAMTLLTTMIDR